MRAEALPLLVGGGVLAAHAWTRSRPPRPLALLGIERARAATLERRPGGWRVLALAGALSFVAGFPETTYLDTLLLVVWFGWRLAGPQFGRAQRRAFAVKVAAGGAVAALLAAPLLIAFADFTAHAYLGRHAGARFASVHLPSQGIAQLLVPYLYGPIARFADPAGVRPARGRRR